MRVASNPFIEGPFIEPEGAEETGLSEFSHLNEVSAALVEDEPAPAPLARVSRPPIARKPVPARLVSLDAYRGLVMVLMLSAGLRIGAVVKRMESTPGWHFLNTHPWQVAADQTEHSLWTGCTLWDLIQPSFMFMVGVSLPFSLAGRRARGQGFWRTFLHAIIRSAALVLLGVFLFSTNKPRTDWEFTGVLGQIGLGYPILFLLAWLKPRWQIIAAILILTGYWAAFSLYPAPPANLGLESADLPAHWRRLDGFAAHWEKNTNLAAHFDQWFLNLLPRWDGKEFKHETGGYQTLNFVPSLATMIFGLLAGGLLRRPIGGVNKVAILLAIGAATFLAGWELNAMGICPLVKRIWTPSWAIYSAGWTFLTLGLFYLVLDVWRIRRWEFPLVVVGANSIAIYCVSQLMKPWVNQTLRRHYRPDVYELPGRAYAWLRFEKIGHLPHSPDTIKAYGQIFSPMAEATVFLLFCWVLCFWAYRKKLFIKI